MLGAFHPRPRAITPLTLPILAIIHSQPQPRSLTTNTKPPRTTRSPRASRDAMHLTRAVSPASNPPELAPRRSTRISLARLAYAAPQSSTAGEGSRTEDDDLPGQGEENVRDIEDAVGGPRKRRCLDGVASERTTRRRRVIVKKENGDDQAIPDEAKLLEKDASPETKNIKGEDATTPRRKSRKPPRQTTTSSTTISPPANWEAIYAAVRRMRAPGGAASNAPVDTMGCDRLADPTRPALEQRFHTLIALMLSSQTKDTVTAAAMRRLQTELPSSDGGKAGLTLANVLAAPEGVVNELIRTVGFHNNKARYIKQTAEILRDQWGGDIPNTVEGLRALPGVGPKMAYLCLSTAWGRTEGIGVDVHVHRITNLWGWHRTRGPEETRAKLEGWLPRERWREINGLLVGLGQMVCLPVGRRCGECELGLGGLCRAAEARKVEEGRRRVKGVKSEEVKSEEVKSEEVVEEKDMVENHVKVEEEEEQVDRGVDDIVAVKKEDA